jgi:hypothetical protein
LEIYIQYYGKENQEVGNIKNENIAITIKAYSYR